MLFKNKNKQEEASKSPYLDVQRHYADRMKETAAMNTWLKVTVIVAMLITVAAVASAITTAARSKYIPYVITVDSHGVAIVSGVAQPITDLDDRIVTAALSAWITNVRTVTVDVNLLRRNLLSAYALINPLDGAKAKLDEFLSGREDVPDPYTRAQTELVNVKVTSIVALSENSYEIDWVETTRDRQGKKIKPDMPMRAVVTWYKGQEQQTPEGIMLNPMGVYIQDFSWTLIH